MTTPHKIQICSVFIYELTNKMFLEMFRPDLSPNIARKQIQPNRA